MTRTHNHSSQLPATLYKEQRKASLDFEKMLANAIVIYAMTIAVAWTLSAPTCKTDTDCIGADGKCIQTSDGVKQCSNSLTNLAYGKPTFQTSTVANGPSSKAVDGDTNTVYHAGSCTHTGSEQGAWWSVDLGQMYKIDHVTVFGRTYCCPERLRHVQLLIGTNNEDFEQHGYHDGTISPSFTFKMTSPVYGRWVKITRSDDVTDSLTLCEVQVFELTNLAYGQPTFQTSTVANGPPSKAVDGDTNTVYHAGSCTHTGSEQGAWWSVDLGQMYKIDHVNVFGRTDCCSERLRDVQLLIGTSNVDLEQQGFHAGTLSPSYTFTMTSPVYGRWVNITLSDDVTDYLTLCEVQVYGYLIDDVECNNAGLCNHGSCSKNDGRFTCVCESGWAGTYCTNDVCANTTCEECPHGTIDDGSCCGQCKECPETCPELTCKNKYQFQDDDMCCPECMCRSKDGLVKPGPVGDMCDGCECVNGRITCEQVQCQNITKLQCVDPVKGDDCCYTCPNGETCRHPGKKNKVMMKGQVPQIVGKKICLCSPTFWYPYAFCTSKNVKATAFPGVENYKDVIADWSFLEE